MPKFNQRTARAAGRGPITSESTPSAHTHQGAPGYARDTKSELFLLAVSNLVGEDTYHESASKRDARYRDLIGRVALADPAWLTGLVTWLRRDAHMRSAALVAALEGTRARLDAGAHGHSRRMVDAALHRGDEPGEALAYWMGRYGRTLPKPLKRGVADAVTRLYGERSLLKYDTASHAFRFGDVIDLVHPTPRTERQGALFAHALDRRHGRDSHPHPEALPKLVRHAALLAEAQQHPEVLLEPDRLRGAAITWESALSLAGDRLDKARLWEALIPFMGYAALLRNLRNFDEAGISEPAAAQVAARLADRIEVEDSRQLPMRFLSAYRAAPSLRWGHALEQALNHSLDNIPRLTGRTLILVDRSGSMFHSRLSARSDLTFADAAAIFGTALALRCATADLVEFGTTSRAMPLRRAESVLRVLERFTSMGGTNTAAAVRAHYRGHDRVVIVTDEQAHGCYGDPTAHISEHIPVYTWNLAGYRHGHGPAGAGHRHTFGGLSDTAFRLIPLIEATRTADWPWVHA